MHFYSSHVIAEYNLSGSKIICNQINISQSEYAKLAEKHQSIVTMYFSTGKGTHALLNMHSDPA